MAIADLRRDYHGGALDQRDLKSEPLAQFQTWFAQAAAAQGRSRWRRVGIAVYKLWHALLGHSPVDVNAMTLATVDDQGRPSSRTVLLKGVDERGFVFFTNYQSRKGRELETNPNAALTFYWPDLERQVCVAGRISRLPQSESAAYFTSRPRGSQLGAWASDQSSPVANRAALEEKWRSFEAKFPQDIPLPPHWGGYVLTPERIEFWQGRPSRLHDRFAYTKQSEGNWNIQRLSP